MTTYERPNCDYCDEIATRHMGDFAMIVCDEHYRTVYVPRVVAREERRRAVQDEMIARGETPRVDPGWYSHSRFD